MTTDDLRNCIKDYRHHVFAGGMIPFEVARRRSLEAGKPPSAADADGVDAMFHALACYIELRQANYIGFINAETGEAADELHP